jgi:hypothetical protein
MWIDKPDAPQAPVLKETDKLALLSDATRDLINGLLVEKWILIKNNKWEYHITLNWVTTNEVNFLVIKEAIPNFVIVRDELDPAKSDIIWNKNNPDNEQIYYAKKDLQFYIQIWWDFFPLKFMEI